jgi:CRP-like cAMP-binding protein
MPDHVRLEAQHRRERLAPREEVFAPSCQSGSLLIESGFVATLVSMREAHRTCVGLLGAGCLIAERDKADGLRWSYFALSEVAVRLIPTTAGSLSPARLQAQDSLCVSQLALVAICNARHNLAERCAQWLMRFAHYLGSTIQITHAFLAEIIGVRRSGVSTVLHAWQQEGVITQGHGQITVLDHDALRRKACSCPMIAATAQPAMSAEPLQGEILAGLSDIGRHVGGKPVHASIAAARQLSVEFAEAQARHMGLQRTTYGLLHGMLDGVTAMQGELEKTNLGLRQVRGLFADM